MNEAPTVEFLGHATFALCAADGSSMAVDPYPPGALGGALGLAPITRRFDFATSTHDHVDHNGVETLPGPPVRATIGRFGPFFIDRTRSFHDEYKGRRRGGEVDVLAIEFDGHSVVHASDIGCSPSPATIDAIAGCDVLILPVGGFYTVGAAQAWEWALRCRPRTIVPMHYLTEGGKLPIRGLDPFLAVSTWPVERVTGPRSIRRADNVGRIIAWNEL